jgi:integrase
MSFASCAAVSVTLWVGCADRAWLPVAWPLCFVKCCTPAIATVVRANTITGIHPKVVSERLGHATVSITLDTYSHAIPAMQEEAAALIAGWCWTEG